MAWIESHQELANHPKTKRFRRALSISTPQAIGHLHMLWWWALDYAQDGNLTGFDASEVAEACGWEGDPHAFAGALEQSGFVDAETNLIHDWDEYGGKYLKRRDQARERQQKHRSKDGTYLKEGGHALVTRDIPVTHALVTPLQDRTGEDKTGQEKTKTAPAARVRGYPPDFEAFWSDVVRKEPSKVKAYEAWRKAAERAPAAIIHAGVMRWLPVWQTMDDKTKIPHITTWLNQDRWTVEQPVGPSRASPPSNGRATLQDFEDLMGGDIDEPTRDDQAAIDVTYAVSDGKALGARGERDREGMGPGPRGRGL
jgi:hypothetical protein